MTPELTVLFEQSPDLKITRADKALYRKFRSLEPNLVSCFDDFDGAYDEEVLVLHEKGQSLGIVSIVIRENLNKPTPPKTYARLDLVVVDKKYRNLGIGRLLIVCALLFILRTRGWQIYSISCLAAHETVEKFLKEMSFLEHHPEEKNFWQGTLNLEEKSTEALLKNYLEKAKTCLQSTAYKLRQAENLRG